MYFGPYMRRGDMMIDTATDWVAVSTIYCGNCRKPQVYDPSTSNSSYIDGTNTTFVDVHLYLYDLF